MTQRDLLSAFFLALVRRKLTLIVTFIVLVGSVGLYTYLEYPLFRATDLVLVRTNPRQELSLFRGLTGPVVPNFKATPANDVIEIARSTGVAKEIVRRFDLEERARRRAEDPEGFREQAWYWIGKTLYSPIRLMEIVGLLEESVPNYEYEAIEQLVESRLEVYGLHNTELMKLSVWEEDPEVSAAMANAIAGLVIEKTNELARVQTTAAFQFIEKQVAVEGALLERLEATVARKKSAQNLIGLDQQQRLLLDRVDHSNRELEKVAQAEVGLSASLGELEAQLRAARAKNLSQTIESQIVSRKAEIVSWAAQKATLGDRLADLEVQLLALPLKQAEIARLERERHAQEKLYVGLNTKLDEFNVQQLYWLGEFDIRIVDEAYLPKNASPLWPEWKLNLIIGVPVALVLTLLLGLLIEYLDETYVTEASLERDLAAPVLGSVPKVSKRHLKHWILSGASAA